MTTPGAEIVKPDGALTSMIGMLEKLKPQMRAALPRHLTPDRMARLVLTTLRRTPRLIDCTPISLAGAVVQACQLGLEPDGALGEFWLTPRRLHGQLSVVGIPGYRGLMKLARQSGDVDWMLPHAVYRTDEFHYEYGSTPTLVHRPGPGDKDPKDIVAFYATARLTSGSMIFWVMLRREVDEVRDRYAAARDDGPWLTHYPEMGMKTVIRRLCKFLPQSTALGRAITLDEAAEAGLPQGLEALVDTTALGLPGPSSTLDRLTDALEAQQRPTAGATTPGSGGSGESSAPAPSSPLPGATGASLPRPPASRKRGGRFPKELDQPVRHSAASPSESGSEPAGDMRASGTAPAAESSPDDEAAHVFPPAADTTAENVDRINRAFDATNVLTPQNVIVVIQTAPSDEELDRLGERIYASAFWPTLDQSRRELIREAITLRRRRLHAA